MIILSGTPLILGSLVGKAFAYYTVHLGFIPTAIPTHLENVTLIHQQVSGRDISIYTLNTQCINQD